MRLLLASALLLALGACNEVDVVGTGGSGGASVASTGSTAASSSVAATTSTVVVSSAASTGAGTSKVSASLGDAQFSMSCMPVVGPDPISGSFEVEYANLGGATGALDVTSATLTIAGPNGGSVTWSFEVAPSDSGAIQPAETASVVHVKVASSGMGTPNVVNPCSLCGGKWTLGVTWSDGVTGTAATKDLGSIGCVF